jgi:hypothetical protein
MEMEENPATTIASGSDWPQTGTAANVNTPLGPQESDRFPSQAEIRSFRRRALGSEPDNLMEAPKPNEPESPLSWGATTHSTEYEGSPAC